jgi:hypothetical protein
MAQQSQFSGYPDDALMVIAGDLRFCVESLDTALKNKSRSLEFGGKKDRYEYEQWLLSELDRIERM